MTLTTDILIKRKMPMDIKISWILDDKIAQSPAQQRLKQF